MKSAGATITALLAASAVAITIDNFDNPKTNALGLVHTTNAGEFEVSDTGGFLRISTNDIDAYCSTGLSANDGCLDMTPLLTSYMHIAYSGSRNFSVSLQENNEWCDLKRTPFPKTWDSIEAARYSWRSDNGEYEQDLYVPISHFDVNHTRIHSITLEGFYSEIPTFVHKISLVNEAEVPYNFRSNISVKLATGTVYKACTRPGLIAFGIDDGVPSLAQQTMQIIQEERIPVTFFVQGKALEDTASNFSNIYIEAASRGHQIALHTYDHPKLEALQKDSEIDWQYTRNIAAMEKYLPGVLPDVSYFRPPYGSLGARTRQRLVAQVGDGAKIVLWSIDIEDWKYGGLPDVELSAQLQLRAFERQLDVGGDIVVMHYLYASTVAAMPSMIRAARAAGRKFVRMDECLAG